MKLLVVCLGNICRSPMGEGALRAQLQRAGLQDLVEVDSAGTGDWHAGEPPDPRAIRCARSHGVDISGLRARQIRRADFARFDWVLCADAANLRDVSSLAPTDGGAGVALWLPWAGLEGAGAIPDPYTGGAEDFERTWTLVDAAAAATVARIAAGLV